MHYIHLYFTRRKLFRKVTTFKILTGQSKIREWTRESLLDKTFTTVKGKGWLEKTPNNIPLHKMYTKLSLVKKHREFDDKITTERLSDISEVLLGQDAECPSSLRVLASGELKGR